MSVSFRGVFHLLSIVFLPDPADDHRDQYDQQLFDEYHHRDLLSCGPLPPISNPPPGLGPGRGPFPLRISRTFGRPVSPFLFPFSFILGTVCNYRAGLSGVRRDRFGFKVLGVCVSVSPLTKTIIPLLAMDCNVQN